MMQKFLIIVKFSSDRDFRQFYEKFKNNRVFIPSSNPLPQDSIVILKLIVPLLDTPVLINGIVVSTPDNEGINSGMHIDIHEGLKTALSDLDRKLSEYDEYQEIVGRVPVEAEDSDVIPDEITGLEMEITDDEIFALEDDHPIKRGTGTTRDDSFVLRDADDDLMNLKMESEPEDSVDKVDLAHLQEFLLQEDNASEFGVEPDEAQTSGKDFSPENAPGTPFEFDLLPDDESVSVRPNKDSDIPPTENKTSEYFGTGDDLLEDLKNIVAQEEFEITPEEKPDLPERKIPEKKDLTAEERQKAEPVGQFFMNLTKAMLRSGYYAPGHPGADSAKAGLYEEFFGVLQGRREIMVTNHHTRDGIDLMLTGILDEPVSIRVLVGPGVAELFVPKLSEYCDRKKLLSFAIRRDIRPDHFYQFIDIMSDPKIDDYKDKEAGKYLTSLFIKHGITDISTVFVDDMVELETDLPWRVEMAIHRLAKDLKVMPMFKGVSNEEIKKMKLRTVQDIIRPLKHPAYLNDFLVNCYIIAKYVKSMAPEEIEEIVVDAFSIHLLLPTSQFTFRELDHLKQLKKEHPDNILIDRRIGGIRRILKLISRRVLVQKEKGSRSFLEQLYRNEVLCFNELPADVQYIVNTMKLADDIRDNFDKYSKAISSLSEPDEALVYLKCFRRIAPFLVDSGRWEILHRIAHVVKDASARDPFNSDRVHSGLKNIKSGEIENYSESSLFKSLDVSERPLGFVFKDVADRIIKSYEDSDSEQRKLIDEILNGLGALGVDIISKMLADSNDREVRKLSYEKMISKGEQARKWAVKVLTDTDRPWFIHRNAMMILGKVSDNEADFDCVRNFLEHSNPKIREEALNAAVSLTPRDGESLVMSRINDEDPKVRWRALRSLDHFSPVSETAMNELLSTIKQPIPKNRELVESHINHKVHIISAINGMSQIPFQQKVETEILGALKSMAFGKQSLWDKVKRAVSNDHETPVLKAAIPLLGKIGSVQSRTFLKEISRSHPDLESIIDKALEQIQ